MKTIHALVLMLFTTLSFAQYPDTIYSSKETRKMAQELTSAYDAQLGLTGRQLPIFQDKIKDYLELSQKAKAKYAGRAELDALTQLAVEESLEMKDILTRIQYNVYKRIRQDIQPIKVVKPNNQKNED
jgi:hypothetical protein